MPTMTAAPVTAPVETVTPIKPSEAIRLGCLTTAPTFDDWFDYDGEGNVMACALGAAMVGWGAGPLTDNAACQSNLKALHFVLRHCPADSGSSSCSGQQPVDELVMHLNDDHRWPRESIADWLASRGL